MTIMKWALVAGLAVGAASASALPALAGNEFGGYFGRYFLPDGGQERNARVIAGAAPNSHATYMGGIRCEFRYIGSGPDRRKYEICE